jgi:hypothetical protein
MSDVENKNAINIEASKNEAEQQDRISQSTTSIVLEAAGDSDSARDIGALDDITQAVDKKIMATRSGLVERLIYGLAPDVTEIQSGSRVCTRLQQQDQPVVDAAVACMANGDAFTLDGGNICSIMQCSSTRKSLRVNRTCRV